MVGRRLHGMAQADRCGMSLRRGGRGSTVTRACRATGEPVLAPPRNRWSKVARITGETGKTSQGETVAARPVVAEKRGNARGAIVSRRREQRHAVREMRVDPSEPPCRGRFQTAISCYGPMAAVVNVMVKRRDNLITSCGDGRDGCKRTADDASKGRKWHQNRGVALPWEKHGGNLLTGHAVSGV